MSTPTSPRWWTASLEEIHKAIQNAYEAIHKSQSNLRADYARFLSVYEARSISSLDGLAWATASSNLGGAELHENVVRSVIDTATAKIGSRRTRPRYLTSGTYSLKDKAEMLGLYCEGVYHQQSVYEQACDMFRDGGIFGTGLLKVYADHDTQRVRVERALVHEIGVSNIDGKYRRPRSLFHSTTVSRSVLVGKYGTKQAAIENATLLATGGSDASEIDDPVTIIEAWHLPSGPRADDGRWSMVTSAGELEDGKWKRSRFPFLVWRWKPRPLGWHGYGLVEDLFTHQDNLDYLNQKIAKILDKITVRMWFPDGGEVNVEQVGGGSFEIGRFRGNPPVSVTDAGPGSELLGERDRLIQSAFSQAGVAYMTATSQVPKNLTSGRAILEAKDTQSERFQDVGTLWDKAFGTDLPDLILDAAEDLDPSSWVQTPTQHGARRVTYSEISGVDRDRVLAVPWPASILPREPEGRIEVVGQLIELFPGVAPIAAGYLNHPDVESLTSLVSAPIDVIFADIRDMERGEMVSPQPFLDLETAKMLVLANYQRLKADGAPESALEAHRQYLLTVQDMVERQRMIAQAGVGGAQIALGMQQPGAGGAPMAGGPGGMPMPPGMPPGVPVG